MYVGREQEGLLVVQDPSCHSLPAAGRMLVVLPWITAKNAMFNFEMGAISAGNDFLHELLWVKLKLDWTVTENQVRHN